MDATCCLNAATRDPCNYRAYFLGGNVFDPSCAFFRGGIHRAPDSSKMHLRKPRVGGGGAGTFICSYPPHVPGAKYEFSLDRNEGGRLPTPAPTPVAPAPLTPAPTPTPAPHQFQLPRQLHQLQHLSPWITSTQIGNQWL